MTRQRTIFSCGAQNCPKSFPTHRGLNRHYTLSKKCRNSLFTLLALARQHARAEPPPPPPSPSLQSRPGSPRQRHPPRTRQQPDAFPGPVDGQDLPIPAMAEPERCRHHVRVEEVPDEGDPVRSPTVDWHPTAGAVFDGQYPTLWERWHTMEEEQGLDPWSPFESVEDWELGKWLMTCGVSQTSIDDFLKLSVV